MVDNRILQRYQRHLVDVLAELIFQPELFDANGDLNIPWTTKDDGPTPTPGADKPPRAKPPDNVVRLHPVIARTRRGRASEPPGTAERTEELEAEIERLRRENKTLKSNGTGERRRRRRPERTKQEEQKPKEPSTKLDVAFSVTSPRSSLGSKARRSRASDKRTAPPKEQKKDTAPSACEISVEDRAVAVEPESKDRGHAEARARAFEECVHALDRRLDEMSTALKDVCALLRKSEEGRERAEEELRQARAQLARLEEKIDRVGDRVDTIESTTSKIETRLHETPTRRETMEAFARVQAFLIAHYIVSATERLDTDQALHVFVERARDAMAILPSLINVCDDKTITTTGVDPPTAAA